MNVNKIRYFVICIVLFALWCSAYSVIGPFSQWVTYGLFSVEENTPLADSVEFFFYDTAKIFLLLALMVYVIGWLRAGMQVERIRDYLMGKGRVIGYFLGAGFGAITPFCSCSSIPLFLGFTTAHIPLGITMSFLITSPLINEIAVVLLWGLLGWKFTIVYVFLGLFVGVTGGIIMDVIHAERWLQPFLLDAMKNSHTRADDIQKSEAPRMDWLTRHAFAFSELTNILRRVWMWVIIGVGLGSILHGYVPQEWLTDNLGSRHWWSVPIAVGVGIPLYTNVTGIIPVMESLLFKGLPLGTTLAFCMSTVAASLPEMLMLKQVMSWKLLSVFFGMLLIIFTLMGWLFNILQDQIISL
ncbi:MAG: permease [Desulfovibrio sp.]|nr:permease [Desulfovibrio sp.]